MKKETKKSVVEQAADALRLWSNAWKEFDKTGKNKPETFEEVIKPFIEMEKEQMGYSEEDLFKILLDFVAFPHHDMEPRGSIIERYLNELSKKKLKN